MSSETCVEQAANGLAIINDLAGRLLATNSSRAISAIIDDFDEMTESDPEAMFSETRRSVNAHLHELRKRIKGDAERLGKPASSTASITVSVVIDEMRVELMRDLVRCACSNI